MKKFTAIYAGAAAIFFVLFGATLFYKWSASAEKVAAVQWEYAIITTIYIVPNTENQATFTAAVNICYMNASGCRNEELRGEVVYNKFLQDFRLENTERSKIAGLNQAKDVAFAKTVAKLGSEGWEMIDAPSFELDSYIPNNQNGFTQSPGEKLLKPDVYFKRIKQ